MPRRLRVDLEGLLRALGCTSLAVEAFLDLNQGTVVFLHMSEHPLEEREECFARYKAQPTRYRHIPHSSARELHQDMQDFLFHVAEPAVRESLRQALAGKGAVARFQAVLQAYPNIAKEWSTFRRRSLLERARHWLAREGIILETETHI